MEAGTPFVFLGLTMTRLLPLPAILSKGNVLKELSDPEGAIIYTSRFQLGDPTLNALEIWGAEYQESNALLLRPSDRDFLSRASARERCPACFVGTITGDKRIVLVDDRECLVGKTGQGDAPLTPPTPVDLDLDWVLGKMPQKEFFLQRKPPVLQPLALPPELSVRQALNRVLRLPAVASKRYLTNKVILVPHLAALAFCTVPCHSSWLSPTGVS